VLHPTARAGIETVGVDLSPVMLERARANSAAVGLTAALFEGIRQQLEPLAGRSHLKELIFVRGLA